MKRTSNFNLKNLKTTSLIFTLILISKIAEAQTTSTDLNQSGLANFRNRVIPILNGIVAVFALLGIFYAVYQFFTGDAERGKKFLTSVIIGGVVWFLAAQIVNAI